MRNGGREASVLSLLDDLALGATEVGAEDELRVLLEEVLGGGDNGAETGVVCDGDFVGLVEGDVQVDAHEHVLAGEVDFGGEALDVQLLSGEGGGRGVETTGNRAEGGGDELGEHRLWVGGG